MRMPIAVVLTLLASASPLASQSSGRFHLVRSASGGKGAPDGSRFVLEDPRTIFQAGKDRQVLVTFEWQGPPGRHRCEGTWKDPSGRVVFTSEAEVNARGPRFGVYWGLSLPDTVATGTWVIEARVDGEPAGTHAFQIQSGPAPSGAPVRRALSVAELYELGLASTLTLEALDATGALLGTASGFFAAGDFVQTSFAGINAAASIRLVTATGRHETSAVVSWSRPDDWAMLRFTGVSNRPIERARDLPQVGERCFFLDPQPDGRRVIVETTVIGHSGRELTLAEAAGDASRGAPVFNELGQVVAAIAGSGVLGATLLDLHGLGELSPVPRPKGSRALALAPAPDTAVASRSLQEMEQAGLFVRPLQRTPHFVSGVLGTSVQRGKVPTAVDQRLRFRRADGRCVAFVTWIPARKEDSTSHFELYDADGQRLGVTEPRKARLRSGEPFVQYWEIALAQLRPGIHRIDVVLGSAPVWRTFFRLAD